MALIVDMPMPKNCHECWLYCDFRRRRIDIDRNEHERPQDCLIKGEMPDKHEELISRQDVIQVLKDTCEEGCIDSYTSSVRRAIFDEVLEVVEDKEILPTILEASR